MVNNIRRPRMMTSLSTITTSNISTTAMAKAFLEIYPLMIMGNNSRNSCMVEVRECKVSWDLAKVLLLRLLLGSDLPRRPTSTRHP